MILDDMLLAKRKEVEAAKTRLPLDALKARVRTRRNAGRFRQALASAQHRPALIAELKRQSPSRGMLRERFDPVSLAQELQEAGASALSVLTDRPFFGGSLEVLRDVRPFTDLPLLRKDFLLDPYQLYEAACYEADAALLIVRVLGEASLRALLDLAATLGLDALVEVHTEGEVEIAVRAGATLIGINHRDLGTFRLDPMTTARLMPKIPAGVIIVAESGIQRADDIKHLATLGIHAVLIGEALMTAPDPAAKVRELFDGTW